MFGIHKDKLETLIDFFKKSPSMVELTIEDLKSLPDDVINSPLNNEYSYGYKNMRTMLCAMNNKLDEVCPLNAEDIEYKGLFFAHQSNKAPDYDTMLGTFYFRVYFGKDTFHVYHLDEFARVIEIRTFRISQVTGIRDTKRSLILAYLPVDSKIGSSYRFVKKSENDTQLYNLLMKNYLKADIIVDDNLLDKLLEKTGIIG
ncbi:MAG: hypothetical protein ACRCWM_08635 [Sarcina sp.]